MVSTVDNAFIKQFEREVHEAFQRQGSKLRGTVRSRNNVRGASTYFQTIGKGTAATKTRHDFVPVMDVAHAAVEVSLSDYYAGEWIDRLDELKLNIDERAVAANAGAYALGRKTDELIITALGTATSESADNTTGLTKDKVFEALETLGDNDVPDDGQRYAVVGHKQWSELVQIEEFSSADYVGLQNLPYNGLQVKNWLGVSWIPMTGLPVDGGDVRTCFIYHKNAIAHASAMDIQTDITWHGDRAAYFVNNMMSQGAGLVDDTGVFKLLCDETPA